MTKTDLKTDAAAKALLLACNSWGDVHAELATKSSAIKGRVFEVMVKAYLQPQYANVWDTHDEGEQEVPLGVLRKLGLGSGDTKGIDLIAEEHSGRFVAVQCKYHQDAEENLSQKECSGLVAGMTMAPKGAYSFGLVCHTAMERSRNIAYDLQFLGYDEVWSHLNGPFFKALHASLSGSKPEAKHPWPTPYEYQDEAAGAILKALNEADRTRVQMTCGSGKTPVSYFVAKRRAAQKVLFMVPNISLLSQTLSKFRAACVADGLKASFVAVCSDDTVGDEAGSDAQGIGALVTTNVDKLAGWLKDNAKVERVFVFSTYQSGKVTADAARKAGVVFDLGVGDECHRIGQPDSDFAYACR